MNPRLPNDLRSCWYLLARMEPTRVLAAPVTVTRATLMAVGLYSEETPTANLRGQWLTIERGEGRPGVNHDTLWAVNDIALRLADRHAEGLWLNWLLADADYYARHAEGALGTVAFLIDRWAIYHQHMWKKPLREGKSPCTQCGGPRAAPKRSYQGTHLCIPCFGYGSEWAKDVAAIRAEDVKRLAGR